MGLYIHVLLAEANNHRGIMPEMRNYMKLPSILCLSDFDQWFLLDRQLQLFFSLTQSLALLLGLAAVSRLPLDLAALSLGTGLGGLTKRC